MIGDPQPDYAVIGDPLKTIEAVQLLRSRGFTVLSFFTADERKQRKRAKREGAIITDAKTVMSLKQ